LRYKKSRLQSAAFKEKKDMKVVVFGATGLVGTRMIQVLAERRFPVSELIPVASEKSEGRMIEFEGKRYPVVSAEEAVAMKPELALFSAGADLSKIWAPRFADAGCRVVDNSACWRMDPEIKLIVPEINGSILTDSDMIIANPNCSTIQMLMPLWPLHKALELKRIVVSTYQSITGTGQKAVAQMYSERTRNMGKIEVKSVDPEQDNAYPYPIDLNLFPHIDSFLENGYTKEEMKMVNETHKIFNDYSIGVTATTVRVPVTGGHSEAVNAEFKKSFELDDVRKLVSGFKGNTLVDDPAHLKYPMPIYAEGSDEVFVGRIRFDESQPNTLNFWCVSDNLRKGAATNAIQIAELFL
jgi:aspartate-semialdehyde dehydrogenase (peptidoglycan organisms)